MERKKPKKSDDRLTYIQGFYNAANEEALFANLIGLAQPQLGELVSDCNSTAIQSEPTIEWLTRRLYDDPPGAVVNHRDRVDLLLELQEALRAKGAFSPSKFSNQKFLIKAKQWTLSRVFDSEFIKAFDWDAYDIKSLFALTYLSALNAIAEKLKGHNIVRCVVCNLPMAKVGKRTYCSVDCRTKFNNKKRDPAAHNDAEKKNRKQRIIKKNAVSRAKR